MVGKVSWSTSRRRRADLCVFCRRKEGGREGGREEGGVVMDKRWERGREVGGGGRGGEEGAKTVGNSK